MMMRQQGTIVLADGDEHGRALVAETLRRAGYETIEVENGAEALEAARRKGTRLVVLEVAFSDMTGYEVCQELRKEHADDLAIFFLSGARTEPLDRATGLLFGADDFIVKPFDASELTARGRRFVSRTAAPANGDAADGARAPADAPHLTERERDVLRLLAAGEGQKWIALELSISQKTVSTHIQHLHSKLGVHSRAELVAYAYRTGLVVATPNGQRETVPVEAG